MAELRAPSPKPHADPPRDGDPDLRVPPWLNRLVEIGPRRRLRSMGGFIGVLAAMTLALGALATLDPAPDYVGTHQQFGLPPCSFRAVFGLPCPGCGGTTAVTYLVHLQPLEALKSSLFGAAVGVGMALTWLLCLVAVILRRPIYPRLEGQAGARLMGYTVVLMLVSWVVKIIHTLVVLPGVPD